MTNEADLLRLASDVSYTLTAGGLDLPTTTKEALQAVADRLGVGADVIVSGIEAGQETGAARFKANESIGKAEGRGEDVWPEMLKLTTRTAAPGLDPGLLPSALGGWIYDIADRACLPLELVAVPALVGLSSLVGSHIRVRPELQSAWSTPPNLWGAIVAPSGVMKSHAIGAALGPIRRMEMAAVSAAEAERQANRAQVAMLEADLARVKRSKTPEFSEIENIMDSISSLEVQTRRYQTNDPTVEKLGELFVENPRGLLLVRDELSGWLAAMSKAGHETSRAFYLEAWGGDSSYTFDRIGRGTVLIPTMCLSVIGAIQPGKLASHVDSAMMGGEQDDGLLQRLQMLVWPDDSPGWHRCDGEPDTAVKNKAFEVFDGLDVDFREPWREPARFNPDAQKIYDAYRDEIENRVRSPEFLEAHSFGSHVGKYRGLAPSLALLLWLIDGGRPPRQIDAFYAEQSVDWCRYLELHARKLYAAELAPEIPSAQALAARVKDGSVTHLMPVRDIGRNRWKDLSTADAVKVGIDELAKLGWVRRESFHTGGRPSVVIALHPQLRGGV